MKKSYLLTLSFLLISSVVLSQNEKGTIETKGFHNNLTNNPLVLINGEVSSIELKLIDPNAISSISILKDQSAFAAFGESGKNGVIIVTTKDKSISQKNEDILKNVTKNQHSFQEDQINQPLVIIDGKICNTGLKWIDPQVIQSISVLKDNSATAVFGEVGKNGVIVVTTRERQL